MKLISQAYTGMDKHPYHLHAVCIHDGNAYSGHYFAFIKDRLNNKWRRFNDIRVADETDEEVFKESNGGHSFMTAYWIVYISDDLHREFKNVDLYSYIPVEKRMDGVLANEALYASMIPGMVNI